jgi:glycine cleavage system aminomethyltransferase T
MPAMTQEARTTTFYDTHVKFDGHMVDFAGLSLPVQFAGINE